MSSKIENLAVIFEKIPNGVPKPGQDLVVRDIGFDMDAELPSNSISVEVLYLALDPYLRGLLRSPEVKSYMPPAPLGQPIANFGIGRVIKSNSSQFKQGDVVRAGLPFAQYATLDLDNQPMVPVEKLDGGSGPKDLRDWLGALGMPGLTAYSSLYEIGQPKKGETIFISSAAGPVGQLVGAISKREGLKVIGSVGSDEKLKYIVDELGFDGGFNYKTESPLDALKRLAPDGIDIYYDNVGGEQLVAAIESMNLFGRIVACGMVSQYNKTPEESYPVKNLLQIVGRRITMRGFMVLDDNMGQKYLVEHRDKVSQWLRDGSFKARTHEWTGIESGPGAFVGMLQGENFGRAVLKIKA